MSNVLLAYPLPTRDSPARLLPLSVLYPGEMFRAMGERVEIWDERFDPPEELYDMIPRADVVGVSAMTGQQCGRAAAILKDAKRINPSTTTIIGGHHARILPDQCEREPFVDRVYPSQYGEDMFPFHAETQRHFERCELQWQTSRGCPHVCTFCALSSKWKPVPAERLRRELTTIHEATGFRDVSFTDPNICFSGKPEARKARIREVGEITRDLGVTWDGNLRAPYLLPDMVEALVWSQCKTLEIGCESGDDHFLMRTIRKGHGVAAIKDAARNVAGSGISVMYSFMWGMPRETHEQRMRTCDLIDWIADTDPGARVSLYCYAPYPGGPMYEDAVRGVEGYERFIPPTTLEGWGERRLMNGAAYWIAGLVFRSDNTRRNFAGDDYALIEPYVELARRKWRARELDDFPVSEVEELVAKQVRRAA